MLKCIDCKSRQQEWSYSNHFLSQKTGTLSPYSFLQSCYALGCSPQDGFRNMNKPRDIYFLKFRHDDRFWFTISNSVILCGTWGWLILPKWIGHIETLRVILGVWILTENTSYWISLPPSHFQITPDGSAARNWGSGSEKHWLLNTKGRLLKGIFTTNWIKE